MAWQPGQSGNPQGTTAGAAALRRMARLHADKALNAILGNLDDPKPEVRQRAAESLLDRGFGKPSQAVTLANEEGDTFRVEQLVRTIVDPKHPDA